MTIDQARTIAARYISDNMNSFDLDGGYIIDEDSEENSEGWYFFYQTAKFIRTNDINDSVVGNSPIFVSKQGKCLGPRRFQGVK